MTGRLTLTLDPRSPTWPLVAALLVLAGLILWPRTLWRRKRGRKLMSRRASLAELYDCTCGSVPGKGRAA